MKYRKELMRMKGPSALAKAFWAKDRLSVAAVYFCEDAMIALIALAEILGVHIGFVPLPLWTLYVGIALMCLGEFIRLWATYVLGRFFTYIVIIARNHRLIRRGPYRFVRHPGYLGGLLTFLGFGVTSQSWIIALTAVVMLCLAYSYRIHVEEKALAEKFGRQYREYSKATAMIIPRVL